MSNVKEDNAIDYWDDIDCGSFDMDNSGGFFNEGHKNHEPVVLDRIPDSTDKILTELKAFQISIKNSNENVENNKINTSTGNQEILSIIPDNSDKQKENTKPNVKVVKQHIEEKHRQHQPKAYNYAELYNKRKEKLLKDYEDEAKRKRMFHSKQPPNFKLLHKHLEKKIEDYKREVTCPVSPNVFKKSKETELKKQQKIADYLDKCGPREFKSATPNVLYKEPFQPKLDKRKVIPEPFNLQSTSRSIARKKFDEENQKLLDEKKRKELENLERLEKESRQTFRKAAEFKANPNPFK